MAKKIKGKEQNEMSFLDHLEVLRWTLVRSTLAVLIMSSIAFLMKGFIFDVIIFLPKDPQFITYRFLCNLSQRLGTNGLCIDEIPFIVQSRTMAGQFSAHIWTSITVGFIAAFPFILWEIWKFIKPALYAKERKNARSFIIISSLLFFFGVLFGYYLITPLSINFLGSYRVSMQVENNTDIGSYIGLLRASVLAAGLIFEMPIIIYFLAKMGLVTPEFLRKYRKYAIVVLLLLAAIITPPDVISQFIVAIPMAILYEVSIFIASVIARKEKKRAAKAQ
ncbi:twin-arginine translocase subunit TatC [Aureibaculum conchae]|uniref:twin-arginine translocase subunit TatC n=1 Tax=Aureibaculum sp. 2308TA14-22 TaxID=3108392 RepID=UPI003396D53D